MMRPLVSPSRSHFVNALLTASLASGLGGVSLGAERFSLHPFGVKRKAVGWWVDDGSVERLVAAHEWRMFGAGGRLCVVWLSGALVLVRRTVCVGL